MCDGKLLFVYGTLKTGGRLNQHMLDIGAIRIKNNESLWGYRMVNTGWFPALSYDGKGLVVGELWAVPEDGFKKLDFVEGVSCGLFKRVTVVDWGVAITDSTGESISFEVYVSDKFNHIDSPELINEEGYYEWPVK